MSAMSTTSTIDHVIESIRCADYLAVCERYAAGVLLDMNLPAWRFQLQGVAAIKDYFVEQLDGLENLHCTQVRPIVTDSAVVVENEWRFDGADGEYLWRAVDVVRIAGEEIVEHTQYCSGPWSPADIARQAAEAPMVRW
jgi:hypothetical protein